MFSSAHGEITVNTYFDTRREADKYPVKIRVRYRGDRKDYPTGKKLTEKEWDLLPDTKIVKLLGIKKEIQASFKIIDDIVLDLNRDGKFSFEVLNLRLSKGTSDTLNKAFIAKMEALKNDGAIGNMLNYQLLLLR